MSNDLSRSSSQSISQFGVIAGASALVLYGLFRRNKTGLALATAGGLVAYKQARSQAQSSKQTATAVFRVNKTSSEAYRLWHNFENLPRFMAHVAAVRVLDDRRSEWTAKGPLDSRVRPTGASHGVHFLTLSLKPAAGSSSATIRRAAVRRCAPMLNIRIPLAQLDMVYSLRWVRIPTS
jgi:Polyketide cyclase / dehydrase and lipid transport